MKCRSDRTTPDLLDGTYGRVRTAPTSTARRLVAVFDKLQTKGCMADLTGHTVTIRRGAGSRAFDLAEIDALERFANGRVRL